jgi:hypothetical protein
MGVVFPVNCNKNYIIYNLFNCVAGGKLEIRTAASSTAVTSLLCHADAITWIAVRLKYLNSYLFNWSHTVYRNQSNRRF